MAIPAPLQRSSPTEEELPEYQPEKYWAVWQYPEGRYAYMIGWQREGWLIVMDSEAAGNAYLRTDARQNRRPTELYRLDELTLPEAFAAARAQPTPFVSSHGLSVLSVSGVHLRGTKTARNIPL